MASSEEVGGYFALGIVGAILTCLGCLHCCRKVFGTKCENNTRFAHEKVLAYDVDLV